MPPIPSDAGKAGPPPPPRGRQAGPPPLPAKARPGGEGARATPRSRRRETHEGETHGRSSTSGAALPGPQRSTPAAALDDWEGVQPHNTVASLELPASVDALLTSLHGFLEQELDHVDPDDRRLRAVVLYELGNLEELVIGDRAQANARYREALELDPTFLPVLRAMRRHHAGDGRWREYLDVLEAEIKVTSSEEIRSVLLARHGELLAVRLADTEGALKSLKAAATLAPASRRAAELLRGIYPRLGRWEDLMEVLRQLANLTSDDVARARLAVEMAQLSEFRLGQAEAAEDLYASALELDPRNEKAAVALRRLYHAHQRWRELSELLAAEAGREHEPHEMYGDLYRAARIAEIHLQDDARAASLLETAAALRPSDPLPLAPLTEIYGRLGRYAEQAVALSNRLRLIKDPPSRAALCFRLGRVREDWLADTEGAIEAYRQALKYRPGHEASIRALARLYMALGRNEELLEVELLRAERCTDPRRRADGYLRAAELCERQLGDVARAVDLYDRAWSTAPGLVEAFRALDRLHRQTGQWERLVEIYERKASVTEDPALARSLLRSAAWIYERQLQDRERAVLTLEKLGGAESGIEGDLEVMIQQARLYEELGRMEELRQALEQWAERVEDPAERTDLRRRIGDLLEGPLRRLDQATDAYRQVLVDEPGDRPTRDRLKAIFERTGRWDDLVEVLGGELDVTADPTDLAPLQLQIGRICEDKLGDLAAAEEAYEAALTADPGFTPALLELEELYRRQGLWDRLVTLLTSQAERISDAPAAAAVMCRAGEVSEERLRDTSAAERFYSHALELEADNVPARQGLERLYLTSGDHRALESHYLREAEGAVNPVLRVRAYLRLGALFEGLGDDAVGAAAAYESALKVVADQPDALHSLVALYRHTGNWERLAELLARVAATTDDREVAVAALKEWAAVVEVHQAERWDPAPILERILDADQHDFHALSKLERIAFERRDLDALLPLTKRRIQLCGTEDPDAVASVCVRAGLLLLTRERGDEAVEVLRRALDASRDYLPAIRTLRRLQELREEWRDAADLLLREGRLAKRPAAGLAARVRAGNILLDRFGEVGRAREVFEDVLVLEPGHELAFGRLVEILTTSKDFKALVQLYRQRMKQLEGAARVTLQLELARLHRDSLGEPRAAVEVYQELLQSDPTHDEALLEVADLCGSQGRWREAEEYLQHLAVATHDDERRRGALLKRATILEEQLGAEDQALEVLRGLLEQHPKDREALGRCMKIYQRRGDWEQTVEMLAELARQGTTLDRINGLIDLAEIYSRTLNDPDKTAESLGRAAALCVDAGEGIERIREYFERRGDFDGLVSLLSEALASLPPEGTSGSVAVRLALARVLAGRLLRPDDAEAEIRRALQASPDSLEARLELASLHLWGDNLNEAISEYMRVLDRQPLSAEAFRGLYRVYERRGDLDRAAAAAQAIVAVGEPEPAEAKLAEQAEVAMEQALSAAAATPLGVEEFWNLLAHPNEPSVARDLLLRLSEYLPQVFADELDQAAAGAVIPLDDNEPLAGRCRLLAGVLGVSRPFSCCVGQGMPSVVTVVPGQPARLIVDERFASRAPPAQLRFAVGRALARLLTQTAYLEVLRPRQVEMILAAAVEPFERGFGEYLGTPREVEELSRSLVRAIPRRVRRTLEEPARSYAAGQPVGVAAWKVAARRSAERAGLLLSGDVKAAVELLAAEGAGDDERALLLRFAVGPHLHEAHRRLGITV